MISRTSRILVGAFVAIVALAVVGPAPGGSDLRDTAPTTSKEAPAVSDSEISTRVTTALEGEPSLHDSSVSVESVRRGVVVLGGDAESSNVQLTAVQLAAGIIGVRRVTSEIQTDTLAEQSLRKERSAAVGG